MGIFSGIKAVMTGAKSAETAMNIVDKSADGIIAGLDKMKFTAEEKSDARAKISGVAVKVMETIASESSIRSITRRYLAWLIMGSYVFLIILGALIYPLNPSWAKHMLACSALLGDMALAVSICYFGYYGVKAVVAKFSKGRATTTQGGS